MASPIARVAGEGPEHDGEHHRDAHQDETVLLDDDATELTVEAEPLVQGVVAAERNWSTWWKSVSQSCWPATPWRTINTPSVATKRTNGAVCRMKRRIPFWIATPRSAANSTETGIASSTAHPCASTSVRKQKNAANIAMAPSAKLTIPEPGR